MNNLKIKLKINFLIFKTKLFSDLRFELKVLFVLSKKIKTRKKILINAIANEKSTLLFNNVKTQQQQNQNNQNKNRENRDKSQKKRKNRINESNTTKNNQQFNNYQTNTQQQNQFNSQDNRENQQNNF